jgi:peptidoglycan/xylan/chitin deacetylase (PgdA/CDA1 family)
MLAREYRVRPLGELVEGRQADRSVAVTFDDGYADNLSEALPLAARQGIPLTVFIAAGPVLDGEGFWWDQLAARSAPAERERLHSRLKGLPAEERRRALEQIGTAPADDDAGRPLTPEELHSLAAQPGVEIGAHTVSHPCLAALSVDEQRHEMLHSRERLEGALGRPVPFLAYPFGKPGDVSAETVRLARDAGFQAAFTTIPGRIVPSSPRLALPRLTVHEVPAEALVRRLNEVFGDSR